MVSLLLISNKGNLPTGDLAAADMLVNTATTTPLYLAAINVANARNKTCGAYKVYVVGMIVVIVIRIRGVVKTTEKKRVRYFNGLDLLVNSECNGGGACSGLTPPQAVMQG